MIFVGSLRHFSIFVTNNVTHKVTHFVDSLCKMLIHVDRAFPYLIIKKSSLICLDPDLGCFVIYRLGGLNPLLSTNNYIQSIDINDCLISRELPALTRKCRKGMLAREPASVFLNHNLSIRAGSD